MQVIIVDPSKEEAEPLLKLAESFYVNFAPLRIGIVFAVNPDPNVTGEEDAGVAFLNAFNYVAEMKTNFAGLGFITEVRMYICCINTGGVKTLRVSSLAAAL